MAVDVEVAVSRVLVAEVNEVSSVVVGRVAVVVGASVVCWALSVV